MNGTAQEKVGAARQRPPTSISKSSDTKTIAGHDAESKAMHLAFMAAPHVWRAALRRSGLPASALVVGLALVDEFANRKTGRCFPSFDAIAESSNLSSRSVRAGVSALRAAGLISTRKTKFDGSLSFFLTAPKDARSDAKLSVRDDDKVTENRHTKRQKNVTRSDTDLSLNLRIEPPKVTYEDYVLPCGPPAAVVAPCAPPLELAHSSLPLAQPAHVAGDGQPSDGIPKSEEETIRAPVNSRDRVTRIQELRPGVCIATAQEVAEWWQQYPRSLSDIKNRIECELGAAL